MTVTVTSRVISEIGSTRYEIICEYDRETFTVQNRINQIAGSNLVEMKTNPNNGEVYLEILDYDLWHTHLSRRVRNIDGSRCYLDLD